MQSLVLYHGTSYPGGIKHFWPNSHFGSKSASIDAIASKWIDGAMAIHSELPRSLIVEADQSRRIIEVELIYDASQCLETEIDWGNPNTIALSNLLRKIPGFEELFNPIWDDLFAFKNRLGYDVSREQRTAALRSRGEPLVAKALEEKGLKVIKYRNVVEGKSIDGDYEYSYCVFEPGLVNIRKAELVEDGDLIASIKRMLRTRYQNRDFDIRMKN